SDPVIFFEQVRFLDQVRCFEKPADIRTSRAHRTEDGREVSFRTCSWQAGLSEMVGKKDDDFVDGSTFNQPKSAGNQVSGDQVMGNGNPRNAGPRLDCHGSLLDCRRKNLALMIERRKWDFAALRATRRGGAGAVIAERESDDKKGQKSCDSAA